MRRVNYAGCTLDLAIPFVLTSKYCELIIHKCQPKTKSHHRLAKAVPYLGFESNFRFILNTLFWASGIIIEWSNEILYQTSCLYILGTEDAVSLLVGFKLNVIKHLTMQHPDAFLEILLFQVSECIVYWHQNPQL